MPEFRFQGGEIVRLRHDHEDLKAGCCGVLWGVYDMNPVLYEACFVHETGETDSMFGDADVDEIVDVSQAPFPERLEEIRLVILGSQNR